MKIKKSDFITSSAQINQCPSPSRPEFAFIGRSNVGKSSLINMITDRKGLAKVSGKPGKTQLINHFLINDNWYLVDLPGYGWAKVSKTEKQKWGEMIHDYILLRESLTCLFVLIDSRLTPQSIDVEFINWLGTKGVPFCILFTKVDKQTKNKTQSTIAKYKKQLEKHWDELPVYFVTSSITLQGRDAILDYIQAFI